MFNHEFDRAQRVWINAPSTLQPYHQYHGKIGIGIREIHKAGADNVVVHFTEGPLLNMIVNPMYLAPVATISQPITSSLNQHNVTHTVERKFLAEAWEETDNIKSDLAKKNIKDLILGILAKHPFAEVFRVNHEIIKAVVDHKYGEICGVWRDRLRREFGIYDPADEYVRIMEFFREAQMDDQSIRIARASVETLEGGKFKERCIIMDAEQFELETFEFFSEVMNRQAIGIAFKKKKAPMPESGNLKL
jgi:hypothetical protein